MYSINNVARFTFFHLKKLVFVNICNAYESHLDFPEHVFMTTSYRLISSLKVIKGKKICSGNLGTIFTNYLQEDLILRES